MSSPHLSLAKAYWRAHLNPGDLAIDATCGNGHDTLFLCEHLLSDPRSIVVGLDIQPAALQNTEALLKKHLPIEHLQRVLLHQTSHVQIDTLSLPYPPRLIVYNLGYLPGGNKALTTQTETTLESIQKSLALLIDGGALSVMCYPGHEEGAKEESELLRFLGSLNSNQWTVCHHRWVNRPNAPSLVWVYK